MKQLIYFLAFFLFLGCSTETLKTGKEFPNINSERSGKAKGKYKGIQFAPSVTLLSREPGNTNFTTPIDYPNGVNDYFDWTTAELNGVTYTIEYEVWNNVVTTNTFLVGSDGTNIDTNVRFMKVENINGVDTLLYADDDGIKDLIGALLYSCESYFGVYYQPTSFDVVDINNDGNIDLVVCQSGTDNHKVTVVHDFLNNPTETVALYDIQADARVLEVTDTDVIFYRGNNCDSSLYSISAIETATPPTSTAALLESMEVVLQANANQIQYIEFTGLPECEYFEFTVKGEFGEYVGFGIGSVKNVDENGEGLWYLVNYEPDGLEPNQIPLPPGNYIAEFPAVPSTSDASISVKIPFSVL